MSQVPRLYIGQTPIKIDSTLELSEEQSHYLVRVLRLQVGGDIKLLGRSGTWMASLIEAHKKHARVIVQEKLLDYHASPDIWLVFAPLKHDKIDALAKWAVELGVSGIWPIKTDYTQNSRLNEERLHANFIQAAEQCSRMDVPDLFGYMPLADMLDKWDTSRLLLHADESGSGAPLHQLAHDLKKPVKAAILIGPEGGFSQTERELLAAQDFTRPCTLGPRILRAETAALVGLSHLQAWLGDGDMRPHFVTHDT